MIFLSTKNPAETWSTIVWKLKDTTLIGGIKPLVLGSPQIIHEGRQTSLSFDGVDDGLIVPVNPLQELKTFTVEVLFNPVTIDSAAPRMVHIQDEKGNRCTIELRITPKGKWYLDTFLKNGETNKGLTLVDSANLYSCGNWYWVALVYDGAKMSQYINAVKKGEGFVALETMTSGQTSIGVRLNRVNWFKGQIHEIRFHPVALNSNSLQHQ